jgi:hypothetical protein
MECITTSFIQTITVIASFISSLLGQGEWIQPTKVAKVEGYRYKMIIIIQN